MKPRTTQERQKLLDSAPEAVSASDPTVKVDKEWLMIAEFGKHYGWQAIEAVLNNTISGEQMSLLISGARKVDRLLDYRASQASFVGAASAQTKKPSATFKSLTKNLLKQSEADE